MPAEENKAPRRSQAARGAMAPGVHSSEMMRLLQERRYVFCGNGPKPTHLLMSRGGGRGGASAAVPPEALRDFFSAYGRDLAAGVELFVVELHGDPFVMHFDVDIKEPLPEEDMLLVAQTLVEATQRYFSEPVRCVVCASYLGERIATGGMHLNFVGTLVTSQQACAVRAGAVHACQSALSERLPKLSWDSVLDVSVLTRNGLRMIGSKKVRSCEACRPSRNRGCAECCLSGKIVDHRVYLPWRVLPEDQQSRQLEFEVRNNHALAAVMCSVRAPEQPAPSTFRMPAGAPPQSLLKRRRGGEAVFAEAEQSTPPKLQRVEVQQGQLDLLRRAVRGFHPNYEALEVREVLRAPSARRGPPSPLVIKVRGWGMSFCLNKMADHSSQSIFFTLTRDGLLRQRCFSRKPVDRLEGQCENFASAPGRLQTDVWLGLRQLFEVAKAPEPHEQPRRSPDAMVSAMRARSFAL